MTTTPTPERPADARAEQTGAAPAGAEQTGADQTGAKQAPALSARRLLLVATGGITAMHLPFWINWLYANYPTLEVQVSLTRTASQFVSAQALAPLTQRPVVPDVWPDTAEEAAVHVSLAEWAEGVVVYPATVHYLARLAAGLADTPSLLTVQCTRAPVVLAPSLPPNGDASPLLRRNLEQLSLLPNVAIAPTQTSRSVTTRRDDAPAAAPMWTVVRLLEERLQLLRDARHDAASPEAPVTSGRLAAAG